MAALEVSDEAEATSLRTCVKVSAKAPFSAGMVAGEGTGGTKRMKRVAMLTIW